MCVEVLEENTQDIRYVSLNARGGSQGAPRVLPRTTFEKVFFAYGASYRMFVKIVAMTETHVTYQRLSGDRCLVAAPRELPLAVFLDTFIAEATT